MVASATCVSTWTGGASGPAADDNCIREDKAENIVTSEVDAFALNELIPTGGPGGQALSLQPDECWHTLLSLNQSWLSAKQSRKNQTLMKGIQNKIKQCRHTKYGSAFLYF